MIYTKNIFSLVLFILLTATSAEGQLLAETESYGDQQMDDVVKNGMRVLESSDGRIISYDTYPYMVPFDVNAILEADFMALRVPSIDQNENRWTLSDAKSSVYQAHWMVRKVIDVFESDLGVYFSKVHVAGNCIGENAKAVSGDLNECYIAFGRRGNGDTPSYAEVDVVAHELGHILLDSETNLILGNESDRGLIEGFCDILGVYIESQIPINNVVYPIDYSQGENVPIIAIRNMKDPNLVLPVFPSTDKCWNFDVGNIFGQAEMFGHLFYLLTYGTLGVVPMDQLEVIDVLREALGNHASTTGRLAFRDETLIIIESEYGYDSREHRSWSNAWAQVLCDEEYTKDCINVGTEVLVEDTSVDVGYQFDGDVVVPSGITLSLTAANFLQESIFMPPGASITVENGGTLNIEFITLTSCDPESKWEGLILEDGANFSSNFGIIQDANIGLEVHSVAPGDFELIATKIEDCNIGLELKDAQNVLITAGEDEVFGADKLYEIKNCATGIQTTNSTGTIKDAFIHGEESAFGVKVGENSDIAIDDIDINSTHTGIDVYGASVELTNNDINLNTGQVSRFGIACSQSQIIIHKNKIVAKEQGISHTLQKSNGGQITNNIVKVLGKKSKTTYGIFTLVTKDTHIKNNIIKGKGQEVGIFASACEGAIIEWNTINAANSNNGIAVTNGFKNEVKYNDIKLGASNGIGNWSSTKNIYHDNNISANNVGLLIGKNSRHLRISCNNFCDGTLDMSFASEIGLQHHHHNLFRPDVSKVVALGVNVQFDYEPGQDLENTECGDFQLFPDKSQGIFVADGGTSTQSCLDDPGSDLDGMTADELCEGIEEAQFDPSTWYAELRQLLGRYFDTHGPNQLPDCVTDCIPKELIRMEYELRLAMDYSDSTEQDQDDSELKAIAEDQYNQLGGNGIVYYPDIVPCPTQVENVPVYTETYKSLVKHIAFNNLNETELSELQEVASYCINEYGEIVSWARGLLNIYDIDDYAIEECESEEGQKVSSVNSNTSDLSIKIFPVPADDLINIVLNEEDSSERIITITDALGRIVIKKEVGNKNNHTINTSILENGYYFFNYYNGKTLLNTKPIIIQH